jgi:hypothetical protein
LQGTSPCFESGRIDGKARLARSLSGAPGASVGMLMALT